MLFPHREHIALVSDTKVALRKWAIALFFSMTLLPTVSAATAPPLGSASSFAVLGGAAVTNTGPSVVNSDLGVSPGSSITGFPPGIVTPPGIIHTNDGPASAAHSAAFTSVTGVFDLLDQPCTSDLTGQDLGGLTLTTGVYCFSSSAQLTGTLTLSGGGVFIFKMGSSLTTASGSSVVMIGGSPCNVFWRVGSSATLGTTTQFQGNIFAAASITLNTGAGVIGRVLANVGAVTMDTNTINISICNVAPGGTTAVIIGSFGTATVSLGGNATKSFTITNPTAATLSGIGFTDTLPAGLVVATPNGVTGSCGGGTITATEGSSTISLSGASLASGGTCTFSVNVTGTTAGTKTNSVTVTDGGTGNTSVSILTVVLPRAMCEVGYASNLNIGDSFLNITNTGSQGNLCVAAYTFDASEEMVSCCSCLVTPNGLVSLSVQGDLISNSLSPSTPTAVVTMLVASDPMSGACDPSRITDSNQGLRVFGTTLHALPGTPANDGLTEVPFQECGLSAAELNHLTSFCGFINANGSGFGICKSCRTGGLGGAKK
jgi:hypothetical protein